MEDEIKSFVFSIGVLLNLSLVIMNIYLILNPVEYRIPSNCTNCWINIKMETYNITNVTHNEVQVPYSCFKGQCFVLLNLTEEPTRIKIYHSRNAYLSPEITYYKRKYKNILGEFDE